VKFTRAQDRRFSIDKVRLPLVALIDVILFLLIYFVMAGTLAGEEAQLAAALKTDKKGSGAGSDLAPQVVYVDVVAGVPKFRLGDRIFPDRASLSPVLAQLPKGNGIVVRVGGAAPVEAAASALQACKDAGFQKVSYVPGK
jgi:biopolymer transport protein ExbD